MLNARLGTLGYGTDPARLGMAGLGDGPDPFDPNLDPGWWFQGVDPNYNPSVSPTPAPVVARTTSPQSNTPSTTSSNLTILGLGLEKALSNIFAPAATSAAQAQYALQQYPTGARYDSRGQSGGIGIGIDGQGIRLSDGSHIGWFPIVAVIGVIYLIQSPGFTRRR